MEQMLASKFKLVEEGKSVRCLTGKVVREQRSDAVEM
jgi:hypothetical protein